MIKSIVAIAVMAIVGMMMVSNIGRVDAASAKLETHGCGIGSVCWKTCNASAGVVGWCYMNQMCQRKQDCDPAKPCIEPLVCYY